ncbi:MAG: radical SAM protein [Candidatus Bathyarchaeota archaeon]|nr:MAG: radical SAM protein [Candidatus Bathyarchaeota archaeon]
MPICDLLHAKTRETYDLTTKPPRGEHGLECGQCANECVIGFGQKGYCGLVENEQGKLLRHGGTAEKGVLQWYYDPLPTNCVSWWVCPGCTGSGYPRYAHKPEAETGYSNLAVFYGSCSADCLFCQNWHYRKLAEKHQANLSARELASKVYKEISCICFFGGDPSTQMPHAIRTSEMALTKAMEEKQLLRICWETNGLMLPTYADQAAKLSLKTGGNIKFDIKTWNPNLNVALCGTPNQPVLNNFRKLGQKYRNQRHGLPLLTASTLLTPGYVDVDEVTNIAKFISEIDTSIPYTLLGFQPAYVLSDLPTTSKKQATECYKIAKEYLDNVRIGNIHLLS